MTFGNLWFGFYTLDFFHDVIAHPFTWQSYIYPISPDSIHARGGSWASDGRLLRSASRCLLRRERHANGFGFRLVRPLR